MVPIRGDWTFFRDFQDQLDHYRMWGLIPEKSKSLRPIMVTDGYFGIPQPCKVVGYQTDRSAVIELDDGYHAIHGEYLAELQPSAQQRLPYGVCFVEILAKYIVIDIETTGFDTHHDRIIEIAAVTYEYGNKVDEFHTLLNPGMLLPADIEKLTGITQCDLDDAPNIDSIIPAFLKYIGTLPLVGHNVLAFDIPFLSAQMHINLDNPVIDTLSMARKVFSLLPRHNLEYLKNILELGGDISHRALQDVLTTNALLWASLAPRRHEQKMWHAYLDHKMKNGHTRSPKKHTSPKRPSSPPRRTFENVDIKSISTTCQSIDETGPLFGKSIVFTGTLSLPREEAMQLAVDSGAILKTSVSGKTDYLVVGVQDKELVGEDGMSSKEEKAHQLNRTGKGNIKIITGKEFLALAKKEEVLV